MAEKRLITVSELRCAVLDPEWRRRWLAGENPPTLGFSPPGSMPVHGTLFHELASDFTGWLSAAAPDDARLRLAETDELWAEMYDRWAGPRLLELARNGQIPSAHRLVQALRAFCGRVAMLRERAGEGFQSWNDVYLTSEYSIERVPFAGHDGTLSIAGRPDAVRHVPGAGIEVVDYKLSRGASLDRDLVQLAIYARLLREVKPGLQFAGVLEYYEPELHEVLVSIHELDSLWDETIYPIVQELAKPPAPKPKRKAPAEGALVAPVAALVVSLNDVSSSAEGSVAERIVACYAEFRLEVRVLDKIEAPQLVRYRLEPGPGVKVVSLANRAEDLQVKLGLPQPPLVQAAPGCVTIDLPKAQPDLVRWRDLSALPEQAGPLAFPIGLGVDGEPISADFSDPNTCHALVAGASGSGKSEFLRSLVASLIRRSSPETLRLQLVDPKMVTFGGLTGCPHLDGPVLTQVAEAIFWLEAAADDMDRRYVELAAQGQESLSHRGPDAGLPYRVLVIDEFGDLILGARKEKEAFETLVTRIAQKGRAAGIHLVLATQRPDQKTLTGLVKCNLPLRVCLRVTNAVNSQIVLDQPGAETLLGRGDLLCLRGRGLERAQAPLISMEEMRGLWEGR